MIEEMLLRIAKRGPELRRLDAYDLADAPALGHRQSEKFFPSSAGQRADDSSMTHPANSLAAWEQAKDAHYANYKPLQMARQVPPAYAGYKEIHALIGSLIWLEQTSIKQNIAHIVGQNGYVVAAIYPRERSVAVRKQPVLEGMGVLSLKHLPAAAVPFDADIASQFEITTPHMLLWYFGQTVPEAVENVPSKLLKKKILLRKLPLIAPSALDLGHLHLIHLFSGGPIYLQTLLEMMRPESIPFLCADLTSLYLTGCLVASEDTGVTR